MSWRITYPGAKDKQSATGYAQPSWHTFDRKEWVDPRGYIFVLKQNARPKRVDGLHWYKIEMLDHHRRLVKTWTGNSWQQLVRDVQMQSAIGVPNSKIRTLTNNAASVLTSDELVHAYLALDEKGRQDFSKKVWSDVLLIFGIQ